jgi:hypothetical protein
MLRLRPVTPVEANPDISTSGFASSQLASRKHQSAVDPIDINVNEQIDYWGDHRTFPSVDATKRVVRFSSL